MSRSRLKFLEAFGAGLLGMFFALNWVAAQDESVMTRIKTAGSRISDSSKAVGRKLLGNKSQPKLERKELATTGQLNSEELAAPPNTSPKSQAEIHFALGQANEYGGNYAEAIQAYEETLRADQQFSRAHHRLALLYEKQNQGDKSGKMFADALKLDPKNAVLATDFGYWLYLRRKWPDAERLFLLSLELNPSDARARNNYALLLARSGRKDEAIEQFVAIGLEPAAAQSNLAFIQLTEGDIVAARDTLQKSINLDQNNSTTIKLVEAVDAISLNSANPITSPGLRAPPSSSSPRPMAAGSFQQSSAAQVAHFSDLQPISSGESPQQSKPIAKSSKPGQIESEHKSRSNRVVHSLVGHQISGDRPPVNSPVLAQKLALPNRQEVRHETSTRPAAHAPLATKKILAGTPRVSPDDTHPASEFNTEAFDWKFVEKPQAAKKLPSPSKDGVATLAEQPLWFRTH